MEPSEPPIDAIEALLDAITDLLNEEKFEDCDLFLTWLNVGKFDAGLIVTLLVLTKSASNKLPFRRKFCQKCRDRLFIIAPDRIERLLSNLE